MIDGISIILLAYNEEDNLRKLLPIIKKYVTNTQIPYEIIVVDTSKPLDNTKTLCDNNGVKYINQYYPGFGGALRCGIEKATMDYIITIDSDGAHNPQYIPTMVSMYENGKYDVVIGSRYVNGGGTHDPIINVLMSKILNRVYGLFFKLNARDLSTNFRMYKRSDIKDIVLDCLNYDVLQEILIKMKWKRQGKISIGEFPIILEKRISGKSKRKLLKFIKSYISTLMNLKKMENKEKHAE